MKRIKDIIKLTNINSNSLNGKELSRLVGGIVMGDCICRCYYANCGGSSTKNNKTANNAGGWISVRPWDEAKHG